MGGQTVVMEIMEAIGGGGGSGRAGFEAVHCHKANTGGSDRATRRVGLRAAILGATALAAYACAASLQEGAHTVLEAVPHGTPIFRHEGWPLTSIQDEDGDLGRKLRGPFPRVGTYGEDPKVDADLINDREDPQPTVGRPPSCAEDPVSVWCTGGMGGGQKATGGPGDTRVGGRRDNALGARAELSGPVFAPKDLTQAFTYMYGSPDETDRNSRVWKEPHPPSWRFDPGAAGSAEREQAGYDAPAPLPEAQVDEAERQGQYEVAASTTARNALVRQEEVRELQASEAKVTRLQGVIGRLEEKAKLLEGGR